MNITRNGMFILHDDFTNLMTGAPDPFGPETLKESARLAATSGAGIISLCVSSGEKCNYFPCSHGETFKPEAPASGSRGHAECLDQLIQAGLDPYGLVLGELRRHDLPVLAKFRVNDRHHIAGFPHFSSQFWKAHPEWTIGHSERNSDIETTLENHPSVSAGHSELIRRDRPRLLDYAVPEVRAKRLAIFREVIERYDVAGATLNFLREPYCVSSPESNAGLLTDFVRQCRQVLDEVLGGKGIESPILGVLLPWDIEFCRALGVEADRWITEGLLDYVSPSEGWVTHFNMDIRPWVSAAQGTGCKVYPAIVGLIAHIRDSAIDFCLPREYQKQGDRDGTAKIMPEHVRGLAHRFYGDGADGLSSFNLYSSHYKHLFPLSALADPAKLDAGERRYAYLRHPLYREYDFLRLILPKDGRQSRSVTFRLHETLDRARGCLRFKAVGAASPADLTVAVNGRVLASERLELIPHDSADFLYIRCRLEARDIQDGDNEMTFSLAHSQPDAVMVQEISIDATPQ